MSTTDFNDLACLQGLNEVARQVIQAAQHAPRKMPEPWDQGAFDSLDEPAKDESNAAPLAPPVMAADAFPALLRDIVQAACANSEAHPVAVAANVLALFCCAVGRAPFQRIGDAVVHARVFAVIVGRSGKSRKGTAEHTPREIFRRADVLLRARHRSNDRMRIHTGGLSSGEGVGYAIRDPREPDEKTGKGGDAGVQDKRLMVIESEFANLLAQIKREGNILSATVRNLWDGRDIEPLTKSALITVTRPHVVILGHITGFELRAKSSENDAANGLLNRFMLLHVHRPKLVPLPVPTPAEVLDGLAQRVADAIDSATLGRPHECNTLELALTPDARDLWIEQYPSITQDREGLAGSLMARSEVYCRMLAMVFALLDGRREIVPGDLLSAMGWIDYWRASIDFIFQTGDEAQELSPLAQELLELIHQRPGIKLSELQEHTRRKKITETKVALETLLNLAPPLIEMRLDANTGGRRAQRYFACTCE